MWPFHLLTLAGLMVCGAPLLAAEPPTPPPSPSYDAELARKLGADENGMRQYVLVVLKTGPNKVPAGAERDTMFKGHFANMERLAGEAKLAVAGPFDGADGWRGMFILATADIEQARQWTATDPVIVKGEMVAEYHKYFGSAALMQVGDLHKLLSRSGN